MDTISVFTRPYLFQSVENHKACIILLHAMTIWSFHNKDFCNYRAVTVWGDPVFGRFAFMQICVLVSSDHQLAGELRRINMCVAGHEWGFFGFLYLIWCLISRKGGVSYNAWWAYFCSWFKILIMIYNPLCTC